MSLKPPCHEDFEYVLRKFLTHLGTKWQYNAMQPGGGGWVGGGAKGDFCPQMYLESNTLRI